MDTPQHDRRPSSISLVLREGLLLTVPGIALGVAGALAITRVAASALFGLSAADPLSYGATAAVQAVVAVAACALPAWRATGADPMIALRAE
jgi:ABC-type antimicrobial peptide transport system permease subunit